jgi:hypothetical protein
MCSRTSQGDYIFFFFFLLTARIGLHKNFHIMTKGIVLSQWFFYTKLYTDYIKWHLTWGNLGPPVRLGLVGREKIQDNVTNCSYSKYHCVNA